MILYGYDASVFNSIQGTESWIQYFDNPNANQIGSINTVYTVGAIVSGWFFAGPCADYFGRRVPMVLGCMFVIVATFCQLFTPTLGGFIAGRLLIGIGQGLALPIGPVYIGELAPPDIRGRIMSIWQAFYSVGSFLAYWINYGAVAHSASLPKNWDWRMVVVFQLLAPIYIITCILFCPETPRWYVQKGQLEKARSSLLRVRDTEEEVDDELVQIHEAIEYEKQLGGGSYKPFFTDPSVRKRFLLALVLNGGQQITGEGSLNSYTTIIYKKVFSSNKQIQLINALNGTFGIIFTLNATWTVDRYGRRFLLILGAIGMAICMFVVAPVETLTPTYANGAKSESVGIAIVFLFFLFIFFYKPSWGATVWIWTSEVFSMNIRAQGMGMASQFQNVANAILNQVFPLFLDSKGFHAFYMFGAINVLLCLFVIFFIPETKGKSLEEVDQLFGGVNHVTAGEEIVDGKKTLEIAHHEAIPELGEVSKQPHSTVTQV
jgi:sugar porter (SP) family MFS transporter